MANRTVVAGEADTLRYVGVKPPLPELVAEYIRRAVILPDWVEQEPTCEQITDTGAPNHTRFGFNARLGLDLVGADMVNTSTEHLALQIALLLRGMGDAVARIEGVYPTDDETPLFSEPYFDTDRIHAYFHPQISHK